MYLESLLKDGSNGYPFVDFDEDSMFFIFWKIWTCSCEERWTFACLIFKMPLPFELDVWRHRQPIRALHCHLTKRRRLMLDIKIYNNAIFVFNLFIISFLFLIFLHLITWTSKNHRELISYPNFVEFFALFSWWCVEFNGYFCGFFACVEK